MFHLDRPMYLLGYLASQSRVYLIDKEFKYASFIILKKILSYNFFWFLKLLIINIMSCSVMGYTLLLSLIEYKTLVMRGDLERANEILPSIPKEHHNRYIQSLQL